MSDDGAAPGALVETGERLSRSCLWQLQRSFYATRGLTAWGDGTVPHQITSNPAMARCYARLLLAWRRDLEHAGQLDPAAPVYVIELGAGSGRLAHLLLRALGELPRVVYVMTDFNARNLADWREHPQLRAWVAAGRLDFARFDAADESDGACELVLLESGVTLTRAGNPAAVIANYILDSLPVDAFSVRDGGLHEERVTLRVEGGAYDPEDPRLLERLELGFEPQPTGADYYPETAFNRLLADYQRTLVDSHLTLPIAALRCLERLRRWSGERLLLLTADKGYHRLEDLLFRREPGLALHGGCFSLMVNYHAIGEHVRHTGGEFFHPRHRHVNLALCAASFGLPAAAELRRVWDAEVEQTSPDDAHSLQQALLARAEELDLAALLALLRWSGWDSQTLVRVAPQLLARIEGAPVDLQRELTRGLREVWDGYLHLGERHDLAGLLGLLSCAFGQHAQALVYLQHSLQRHGPTAAALHNLAVCHQAMHRPEEALATVDAALALDPQLPAARVLRIELLAARDG